MSLAIRYQQSWPKLEVIHHQCIYVLYLSSQQMVKSHGGFHHRLQCSDSITKELLWHLPFCWISPWIKSISNELDSIIRERASQMPSRLWCHHQRWHSQLWRHHHNVNIPTEASCRCVKIVFLFMGSSCCLWNRIMYTLEWRAAYALIRG